MAFFQPQTQVRVLRNVPLDNSFRNTLTFTDGGAQVAYFSNKTKFSFTDFTYQREENAIRVPQNAETLFDCNYIMYQNTNFGAKWFFAFITRIEYRSATTSFIYFELDPLQTWYFDYTMQECFVEREHVSDDTVGINTVPEDVELGPYLYTARNFRSYSSRSYALFATEQIVDAAGTETLIPPGDAYGTTVGCWWTLTVNDFAPINNIIQAANEQGKIDAIISIFSWPSEEVTNQGHFAIKPPIPDMTFSAGPNGTSYSPVNNKLRTYPYICAQIETPGNAVELRYELLGSLFIDGVISLSPNPTALFYPLDYGEGNSSVDFEAHLQESIPLTGWPVMPFISNYYQGWVAQNGPSLVAGTTLGIAASGVALIAGAASMNPVAIAGGVIGLTTTISNAMSQQYQAEITPDTLKGSLSATDSLYTTDQMGVATYCKCIRYEYLKRIDDYFSYLGYRVNSVKIPERYSRPSWNFVKTLGCTVTGPIPQDDARVIEKIFDTGITLWHGDFVGDYSRNNQLTG